MSTFGINFQLSRYSGNDQYSDLPVSINEWREKSRRILKSEAWGYLEGGAGSEETMSNNNRAFSKWKIRPRYLRDVAQRDLSISLFGRKYETPFILAPIGVMSILHSEAEIAAARGSGLMGIPFILSTVSSFSIEDVTSAAPDTEKWFQLYPGKNMDIMKSMVNRAEKSGFKAIVVTVDTTMLGWRERDLSDSYLPFLKGMGIANYTSDPVFRSLLTSSPEEDMQEAIGKFLSVYVNPSFSWDDLKEIRKWTGMPMLLRAYPMCPM